jgi:hypothetical protein
VKRLLISAAQLLFGLGLVALLFARMENRDDLLAAARDAGANAHWLGAALLVFLGCLFICALRWHILLAAQGLRLPFRRTLSVFFIGHFFNSFLFGATGGDVVKAYYAARETRHRKTEAVATVVLDRLIGLAALVALIVAVMLARLPFFLERPETRVALVFFSCLFAATLAGAAAVFRRDLLLRVPFARRLLEHGRLGAILGRVYAAFQIAFTHPGVLWRTVALSVANHLLLAFAMHLLALAVDVRMRLVDSLTVFPIINAVAAIPLTPGGLGTRETSAKFMMGAVGVADTRAVLVSLLTYGLVLAWSLVGGLFYAARSLRGEPRPTGDGDDSAPA